MSSWYKTSQHSEKVRLSQKNWGSLRRWFSQKGACPTSMRSWLQASEPIQRKAAMVACTCKSRCPESNLLGVSQTSESPCPLPQKRWMVDILRLSYVFHMHMYIFIYTHTKQAIKLYYLIKSSKVNSSDPASGWRCLRLSLTAWVQSLGLKGEEKTASKL